MSSVDPAFYLKVSPGKTNIWGSPVQNNSLPKKEEDVQNILQMLKGPSANGHGEVKVRICYLT